LAIIDIALPGVGGIELAGKIKSDPVIAGLRLVLLTSDDHETSEICDIGENVVGCLSRPVRQSALRACLAATGGDIDLAQESASPPPPAGVAGAPVLLVEDNPVNLEVAVGILESFGCKVETAMHGKEALERYASGEFGLIFMDCQMPVMDGFETTSEIRKREARSGRHVPIVALTASAIEGDREQCLASGMDDYVTKPFTADQMRSVLATWLGRSPPASAGNAKRDHLTLVAPAQPDDAPPSPALTGEPIDDRVLDVLAGLQQAGRPGIIGRVISLFLQSAPFLLKDLEEGAAKGDMALLHRASHTLKSASANVGAVLLSAHCKELEALARTGSVPDAAARVATIIEDYRRAEAVLTVRLPQVA
jgi:CheY-like chemotaxis protein/HPt (histidine-containing phosphotransfer) domain-containing protein